MIDIGIYFWWGSVWLTWYLERVIRMTGNTESLCSFGKSSQPCDSTLPQQWQSYGVSKIVWVTPGLCQPKTKCLAFCMYIVFVFLWGNLFHTLAHLQLKNLHFQNMHMQNSCALAPDINRGWGFFQHGTFSTSVFWRLLLRPKANVWKFSHRFDVFAHGMQLTLVSVLPMNEPVCSCFSIVQLPLKHPPLLLFIVVTKTADAGRCEVGQAWRNSTRQWRRPCPQCGDRSDHLGGVLTLLHSSWGMLAC